MQPTLHEGQGLLTTGYGAVKAGQIRCFEHPTRPGFWLVKRVSKVHANGTMTVTADNPDGVDSRSFGDVACRGSYRVLLAVPLRLM